MSISVDTPINGTREAIWKVITDFENAKDTISGIEALEIIKTPDDGLVGFTWKETRNFMGKSAEETMWITEATENESYQAAAESHGMKYFSNLTISGKDGNCTLTMTHESQPQTFMTKLMGPLMGIAFSGMLKKCIAQDLADIKAKVEAS